MTLTIHKCVCNVIVVTNPTQYSEFEKYKSINPKFEIGPKLVRRSDFALFLVLLLHTRIVYFLVLGAMVVLACHGSWIGPGRMSKRGAFDGWHVPR